MKILFLIPNLMHGGAEKVLVNLVNNMSKDKYEITVQTLFDEGIHKKNLKSHIRYKSNFKKTFKGYTTIMKLFSPEFLYNRLIGEEYDIVVAYLEGAVARILSGCPYSNTKKVSWIHIEQENQENFAHCFKSFEEAKKCYNAFDKIICVSQTVADDFRKISGYEKQLSVLYNTNETEKIKEKGSELVNDVDFAQDCINVCSVAKIMYTKGYDRLAKVHKRLLDENLKHHIYILGIGEEQNKIEEYLKKNNLESSFTFLGFKENPYKYVSKCDLYVCSSRREGFSTAVTEALVLGVQVVSTECSGAVELLGENNEYGIVVENSEEGIYQGMEQMLANKNALKEYREKAKERGAFFSKEKTVKAVENMFQSL